MKTSPLNQPIKTVWINTSFALKCANTLNLIFKITRCQTTQTLVCGAVKWVLIHKPFIFDNDSNPSYTFIISDIQHQSVLK